MRDSLAEMEKRTTFLKNSKSLTSLSTVKEVVGTIYPKNLVQAKETHSGSVSHR